MLTIRVGLHESSLAHSLIMQCAEIERKEGRSDMRLILISAGSQRELSLTENATTPPPPPTFLVVMSQPYPLSFVTVWVKLVCAQ